MVRVISVHHFAKQDINTCPEASACAVAGASTLVLATCDHVLEVRDLSKAGRVSHSFQTISRVRHLLFSPVGRYLATLEDGGSVRAYVNWDDVSLDGAPVRPRIAASVTPSASDAPVKSIDMIEFPQKDSPVAIALCETTGNLLVAAPNLLVAYKLVWRVHEVSRSKFIDFQECFHVFHNLTPLELSLSEDVIGCLSATEVHVFKVKISDYDANDEKALRSMSLYSFTSDSECGLGPTSREDRCNSDSDCEKDVSPPALMHSLSSTLRRRLDSESNENSHLSGYIGHVRKHPNHVTIGHGDEAFVVRLPEIESENRDLASVIGTTRIMEETLGPSSPPLHRHTAIKCIVGNHGAGDFEAECVTLLYCKLNKSEQGHEAFKNLVVKPVYWREFRLRRGVGRSGQQNPLHSPVLAHLMSYSVCFTSHNEGYLYHVPGHVRRAGRGCGVQRIAMYPFTSPVGCVALQPAMLHAVTDAGLETYTLRSGYYTVLEAEGSSTASACPPPDEMPICLVGLRPFTACMRLLVTDTYLVILAGAPDRDASEASWTLYVLTLPPAQSVHSDIMQLADVNRTISPQGYFQLLSEAHIMLRSTLHYLSWLQAFRKASVTDLLSAAQDKYEDTCVRLASFYLASSDEADSKLALPYFRMSKKPVSEILKLVKSLVNPDDENSRLPEGAVLYLKEIILNPTAAENIMNPVLADDIINLLGRHSLNTLALLVLKSPGFRSFKTNKMYDFFKAAITAQTKVGADFALALILLCLEADKAKEAEEILKKMYGNEDFSDMLVDNNGFLFDSTTDDGSVTLSEFALLLRASQPELFVDVFVGLVNGGIVSLSGLLQQLLDPSFLSPSSASERGEAAQASALLQLFLEAYFSDRASDADEALTSEQEEALNTLVRAYLACLSVPVRYSSQSIDSEMFGSRHAWLDRLPPFDSAKRPTGASPDAEQALLKLQSLLCSPSLALPSCKSTVLTFLSSGHGDVVGSHSLSALCLPPADVVRALCRHHPAAFVAFAKCADPPLENAHWREALALLQELCASTDEHPMHEAWYSGLQEVLDHLAQKLSLSEFLDVLPRPHSSEEFQGYIQMCRKNQQARDLQKLIIATGQKLLSTLVL